MTILLVFYTSVSGFSDSWEMEKTQKCQHPKQVKSGPLSPVWVLQTFLFRRWYILSTAIYVKFLASLQMIAFFVLPSLNSLLEQSLFPGRLFLSEWKQSSEKCHTHTVPNTTAGHNRSFLEKFLPICEETSLHYESSEAISGRSLPFNQGSANP